MLDGVGQALTQRRPIPAHRRYSHGAMPNMGTEIIPNIPVTRAAREEVAAALSLQTIHSAKSHHIHWRFLEMDSLESKARYVA